MPNSEYLLVLFLYMKTLYNPHCLNFSFAIGGSSSSRSNEEMGPVHFISKPGDCLIALFPHVRFLDYEG